MCFWLQKLLTINQQLSIIIKRYQQRKKVIVQKCGYSIIKIIIITLNQKRFKQFVGGLCINLQLVQTEMAMNMTNDIIIILQQELQALQQQNNQLKKDLAEAKFKPKSCPNKHVLQFQQIPWGASIICDTCHKEINEYSYMNWICKQCDYNQCHHCASLPIDFCSEVHPLLENQYSEQSPYECNICLKKLRQQTGYRCDICDYDVCQKCNGKFTQE